MFSHPLHREHSIITSRLEGGGLSIFRDAAWRKERGVVGTLQSTWRHDLTIINFLFFKSKSFLHLPIQCSYIEYLYRLKKVSFSPTFIINVDSPFEEPLVSNGQSMTKKPSICHCFKISLLVPIFFWKKRKRNFQKVFLTIIPALRQKIYLNDGYASDVVFILEA